ncbi:hypothetical protein F1721_23595 [Saccharopolyspora hirsuta]|uniref:Uncharacterized protein n=1 Tax=Saccharopolyspora hirsuta TaxID=1837 RepID=A0A5M7BKB0_SACHI|nr:hypothetical protein [Saccharopolyspora hirsuta]KAA5830089.1 hypothetical protein F1721_23595 [Saccharopolyspora hirsuta]
MRPGPISVRISSRPVPPPAPETCTGGIGRSGEEASPMTELLWAVGFIAVFLGVALALRGLARWR